MEVKNVVYNPNAYEEFIQLATDSLIENTFLHAEENIKQAILIGIKGI
ncbi:MAG: hypothetical protein PHZ03_01195 [Syntrophomonas sp.]|nr:hypothetical protein [Syntrophomonas sp.]